MRIPRTIYRLAVLGALVTGIVGVARHASADELTLTIVDGRVTLLARDVPVSAILEEWARVGQTTFVNGEKVTGGVVTLQFDGVPERDVLDILLRSASGYMAAPRATPIRDASMYDRVLIMATSENASRARSGARSGPSRSPAGRAPFATPRAPAFPADSDESAAELGGTNSPSVFDQGAGTQGGDGPPFPTPAGQPLTPLLPGAGGPGTPPSLSNPFGIPAGVAAAPGIIVQPQQPQQPGRTP